MVTELRERVGAWVWALSLASCVALMLRPLPHAAEDVLETFPQADLCFHFSVFVYLRLLPGLTNWGRHWAARITVGLVAFGALLEIAQAFTASRTPSLADAVANTAGVYAGTMLCQLLVEGRRKHDG